MANFNLTDASALFKQKYGKISDNVYNSANVTLGRIKKDYNFVGKEMKYPVPITLIHYYQPDMRIGWKPSMISRKRK